MLNVAFDTHEFVKELQNSGFQEQQAEALSRAMKKAQETHLDQLATKHDLSEAKLELIKWMIGTAGAIIGILFALLRFLPPAV